MHRRTNIKKNIEESTINRQSKLDNRSEKFGHIYKNIPATFPNILNFDYFDIENKQTPIPDKIETKSKSIEVKLQPKTELDSKKCGIKTLINTHSKLSLFPYKTDLPCPIVEEKQIQHIQDHILKEALDLEENFAHLDKVSSALSDAAHLDKVSSALSDAAHLDKVSSTPSDAVHLDKVSKVKKESKSKRTKSQKSATIKIESGTGSEIKSEIKSETEIKPEWIQEFNNEWLQESNRFNANPVSKVNLEVNNDESSNILSVPASTSSITIEMLSDKIDIKNKYNNILNTINNMNIDTSENITPTPATVLEEPQADLTRSISSADLPRNKEPIQRMSNEFNWPSLTIKNVNTTFKVIGDLKDGAKVKIVDDKCLAVDDAYITSLTRYTSGQSREKTMSFLDHLLEESKRISYNLLKDIRISYANSNGNNNEVNNKLSELRNMHRNLNTFLHKFDTMKNVYKNDSKAYAALSDIRNNFYTFEDSFYRELVLGNIAKQ